MGARATSRGLAALLAETLRQYPFVNQYHPVVVGSRRSGDYAETWLPDDNGDASYPRPSAIPLNSVGVEVMRPGAFGPSDLAAEMLHVDPFAKATRKMLAGSLAPPQLAALKRESGDYQQSLNQFHMTEDAALANGIDSAMRGYTVGQWPDEANAHMNYTQQQRGWLDNLKLYMRQGIYPSSYRLPAGGM
jgi:hypothetical protein